MAWTETASFPATRSLQGQAARTARCDTACKALGKQQGAARPLLWEKKRLGCQATAHQWKQSGDHQQQELEASHLYAKGPQQPALGTDAVLGGDGAISALTPAVAVLKDLIYQGNQRSCPPRKQLSLGRETASTSESAQAAASTADTQQLLLSRGARRTSGSSALVKTPNM